MAVAQGAGTGPFTFHGKVWHPKALPATPAVGGHKLTTPQAPKHPAGYHELGKYQAKKPSWPAAGATTVQLGQSAAKSMAASAQSDSSGLVKAGSLPVWVAPATAGATGKARSAATPQAATPASVNVQMASHEAAQAAGSDGLLLGFARADGSAAGGQAKVVIDYSALDKAYGGGWASRLHLVQVPGCALTTPQVAACRVQTPLEFENRVGAKQLTATVSFDSAGDGIHSHAMAAASAAPMTAVMATSGTSGSQGSYTSTSLSPSGTWAGSGTGAFTYSYPIETPAALGGNGPSIAFSYDSQSQDGKTSARNSQASWIGDGWDYDPGFIEQSYRSCGSLLDSNGNYVLKSSGDECWGGDNATMSFGSHSGVLVPIAVDPSVPGETNAWKLQGDDGTLVQELSGAQNGLYNGTYFRVVTTDGTAAYFGANHAPGSVLGSAPSSPTDTATNSAWGVPVLHPVSGNPCYNSSQGTASKCSQPMGWRWNLDFIVSPTGFVQRYDYGTETNYYDLGAGQVSASGGSGTLTSYTRGGTLTQVSYGYTLADAQAGRTPAAQVVFTSKQRCQQSSADCQSGNLNANTATAWPDVPYDLNCPSTDVTTIPPGSTSVPSNVCVIPSPSYWTTTRLDSITTKVNVPGNGLTAVDSYQLGQIFSDAGGTVDPVTGTTVDPKDAGSLQAVMWLQSIQHTGQGTYNNGNSPLQLNQVSFTGTEIDNRVNDVSPSAPPLYRPRISSVQTETGASIAVAYNLNPCAGVNTSTLAADSNTKSCYPVYWTPSGTSQPILDWFNKITVSQVTNHDLTVLGTYNPTQSKIAAGSRDHLITYSYNAPAWHRDDSAATDDRYRTWGQFRGFQTVTVQTGAAPDPITQQVTTYLQGMNGDYKADGSQRSVSVTDSVGDTVTDDNVLANTPLEKDTYTAANGLINAKTVTSPPSFTTTATIPQTAWSGWVQAEHQGQTAPALSTLPPLTAQRITSASSRSYALLADGKTWRQTKTDTTFDSQSRVSTLDAHGDVTVPAQEKCTTTTYASPSAANPMMLTYPDQTTTVSGGCAPATAGTLISDKQVYYGGDGTLANLGAFGQLDGTGRPTGVRIATGYSGTTENWETISATAYDGAGRATSTRDANGLPTSASYSPAWTASGGNTIPTTVTSTNSQGWQTTSVLDPQRGLPLTSTDANGGVTTITYDALGRRTQVWLPGRSQSANPNTPDKKFSYSINAGAVPAPGGTITSPGAPSSVTTQTIRDDSTYATAVEIYDGMLQPRQSQTTPLGDSNSGRLISDSFFDSHGWSRLTYPAYSEPNNSPSSTVWAANETDVPSESVTVYDGEHRPTAQQLYRQGIYQWQSTTSYPGADETDSTAPAGGPSTAKFTNALGQTVASTVKNTNSQVTLNGGQLIPSGTSLMSNSVRLTMQADGNLVLFALASGKTLWSSGTSGNPGAFAKFGTDGNLVVNAVGGSQLWSSGIAATTGAVLTLQNDANLVTYASSQSGAATLWSTATGGQAAEADATTRYTYTPAGQVSQITDTAGNAWTYSYNLLGQKISQVDPNTGTTTFDQYDNLGNLLQTTDPRGQVISYMYDWANRRTGEYTGPWSATPSAANQLASWTFDTLAKGYPTSKTRYVGSNAYTESITGYNAAYQPLGQTLDVPSADGYAQPTLPSGMTAPAGQTRFAISSTYTPTLGLLAYLQYQNDGGLPTETVNFGYNQQGGLNGFGGWISPTNVPAYLAQTVHDPFGRVLQSNYQTLASGKQVATFAQYDNTTGRLMQRSSMLEGQTIATDVVNYRYNQVGEVTAVDDLQNNTTHDTQCFTYDSFQRLTTAWTDSAGITSPTAAPVGGVGGCNSSAPATGNITGPAPYWQDYRYDLLGDRTAMVSHDTTGNALNDTTQTTAYPGIDGTTAATTPNQATATTVSNPGQGSATLTQSYTESSGKNAGNTNSRGATASGYVMSGVTTTSGGALCLTDPGASTTPGTAVVLSNCGGTGQTFTLGLDTTIRVAGLCLDTAGGATVNSTQVVVNTCSSAASQKWRVTSAGKLLNSNSGRCLTDPSASQVPNGPAQVIYDCSASGQTFTPPSNGTPVLTGSTQYFTYDAEGRTHTVNTRTGAHTATSTYLYDADGSLLEQSNTDSNTRILYLFGGAEQITLNTSTNTATALRYYHGPDGTTITRASSGAITYQLADAQGTAETAIDANSLAVTRRYFDPYGRSRGPKLTSWVDPTENHSYLGQPADVSTGLNLLGARNYDPTLGRFLTADPLFEAGDPNQMGGYTYGANNPTSGSDPTGLDWMPGWLHKAVDASKSAISGFYHATIDDLSDLQQGFDRLIGDDKEANDLHSQQLNPDSPGNGTTFLKDLGGDIHSSRTQSKWYRRGAEAEKAVGGPVGLLFLLPAPAVDLEMGLAVTGERLAAGGVRSGLSSLLQRATRSIMGDVGKGVADAEDIVAQQGAGGLARRTSNTGPFEGLPVPMQRRAVKEAARQAGVSLDGVPFKINRDADLIGRQLYGWTAPDRTITLYPDAFSSMENLVRTIGHERTHVMQIDLYGPTEDIEEERSWERAAFAAEDQFWNHYNGVLG